MGNKNAINNKDVFPLIQNNKVWLGTSSPKEFNTPNGTTKKVSGLTRWFTNLDHGMRHEELILDTMANNLRFNKRLRKKLTSYGDVKHYSKYDNYNAIEVPFMQCIPSDYDGIMGVPVTFFDKYNPEQFEVIGASQRHCHDRMVETRQYDSYHEYNSAGEKLKSSGSKTNGNPNLLGKPEHGHYFMNDEGRTVYSLYTRIFVKLKHPKKD